MNIGSRDSKCWLVTLSIICLSAACSKRNPVQPAEVRPTKTMVIGESGATYVRYFPGRVEAAKTADLSFQMPGLVIKLPVKEGQKVVRGQMISQHLPGMTATVAVTYRRARDNRTFVPISAVTRQDTGHQVVWILGADATVRRRAVKMGEVKDGEVEIVRGLKPGERIAVAGATYLRDGMKVRDLGDALEGGP